MSLQKMKKWSGMQLAALLMFAAFTMVLGACPDDGGDLKTTIGDPIIGGDGEGEGEDDAEDILFEILPDPINYATEKSWGAAFTPVTLGLTPGNDTTEINLNWYSSGAVGEKTAQARFIRGTKAAGTLFVEATGTVSTASSGYSAHKVTVTGLRPGFNYVYAVSNDGINWTDMFDFKIPASTGDWKFAVISDPQLNAAIDTNSRNVGTTTTQGWADTMKKIVAAGVSFIVSGGDQVDTSNSETQYTSLFAPDGLRNLPFAPVVGNHDTNVMFKYHYNLPNDQNPTSDTTSVFGNYYYLYNNILFVGLNTSEGNQVLAPTNPAAHITRFENTIEAAKEAHKGKYDWLIVHHHKSTASVAEHLVDLDIETYVKAGFERVMSEKGVDFVLAGHDHVYARSYPLKGKDSGLVSIPDTTKGGNDLTGVTDPIYLTFTTGSGLKYYEVAGDPYFAGTGKTYTTSTTYPYLGTDANGNPTLAGSTKYKEGILPVSNAAFVQPYIPSYTVVEVSNSLAGAKTIKFSTYANTSVQNEDSTKPNYRTHATLPSFTKETWSFDATVPYDWVKVTK